LMAAWLCESFSTASLGGPGGVAPGRPASPVGPSFAALSSGYHGALSSGRARERTSPSSSQSGAGTGRPPGGAGRENSGPMGPDHSIPDPSGARTGAAPDWLYLEWASSLPKPQK
jgi:hypothetical protein